MTYKKAVVTQFEALTGIFLDTLNETTKNWSTMIGFRNIINRHIFYLRRSCCYCTPPPFSTKKPIEFGPIDRGSPCLQTPEPTCGRKPKKKKHDRNNLRELRQKFKQEVLGRTNRLLSFDTTSIEQKMTPPTFLRCHGKVFTEPLPSNYRGIHRENHTLSFNMRRTAQKMRVQ
jgi:hypothetical protein